MNDKDLVRRTLLALADGLEINARHCGATAKPFMGTSPFTNGLCLGGVEALLRAADTLRIRAQQIAQGIDFSAQPMHKPGRVEPLQRWRHNNEPLDTVVNVGEDGWGRDMVLLMRGHQTKADEMIHDNRWHYLGKAAE